MGWPSPRNRWIERLDRKCVGEMIYHPISRAYFNMNEVRRLWKKAPESYAFEQFLKVELFMRVFGVEAKKSGSFDISK